MYLCMSVSMYLCIYRSICKYMYVSIAALRLFSSFGRDQIQLIFRISLSNFPETIWTEFEMLLMN